MFQRLQLTFDNLQQGFFFFMVKRTVNSLEPVKSVIVSINEHKMTFIFALQKRIYVSKNIDLCGNVLTVSQNESAMTSQSLQIINKNVIFSDIYDILLLSPFSLWNCVFVRERKQTFPGRTLSSSAVVTILCK